MKTQGVVPIYLLLEQNQRASAVETKANFIYNVFKMGKSESVVANTFETGREKLVRNLGVRQMEQVR